MVTQMVSPGLVTDLTVGTLQESGYDPMVEPSRTFVSLQQERGMESTISKKTICMVNGIKDFASSLDHILSQKATYCLEGTKYSMQHGSISRQDFKITNQLRRDPSGRIQYTALCTDILEFFPSLIQTATNSRMYNSECFLNN